MRIKIFLAFPKIIGYNHFMTNHYCNPWKNTVDVKKLAKRLDMHPVYIAAVLYGRSKPSAKLGRNIEKKTNGLITYDLLMENFLAHKHVNE